MISDQDKAEILVDALPYIQEFSGTTVVVKYGGNAMIDERLKENVMRDVALMKYVGIRPILVHGGGPEITAFLKRVGKETTFVSGLRVQAELRDREPAQSARCARRRAQRQGCRTHPRAQEKRCCL